MTATPTPAGMFGGLQVFEQPLAFSIVPKRQHKHRRNQSKAYHKRVQKKWRKRFGTVEKPAIYRIGDRFFVHPALMAELRKQAA